MKALSVQAWSFGLFSLLGVFLFGDALADSYEIREINVPGTTPFSGAVGKALNNHGVVVGEVRFRNGTHGFFYKNGHATVLGSLSAADGPSSLCAVNDHDQALGWAAGDDNASRAVLYDKGELKQLSGIPGSAGLSLNNRGSVTGTRPRAGGMGVTAFIVSNGQETDKPDFVLLFVNDQEAMAAELVDVAGPYLVVNGAKRRIPCVGTGSCGWVSGINNNNQVIAGFPLTPDPNSAVHAYLWDERHGAHDLGVLAGDPKRATSQAIGINNHGDVVGQSCTERTPRPVCTAFVYKGGKMRDLNSLVSSDLKITLTTATAINDSGQVLAMGTHSGPQHGFGAFLLTPK
jgi:probable HAF family extracellular repeat protein